MAGQSRARIWNRSAKGKEGGKDSVKRLFYFFYGEGVFAPRTYFKVHSLLFLPFSPQSVL